MNALKVLSYNIQQKSLDQVFTQEVLRGFVSSFDIVLFQEVVSEQSLRAQPVIPHFPGDAGEWPPLSVQLDSLQISFAGDCMYGFELSR